MARARGSANHSQVRHKLHDREAARAALRQAAVGKRYGMHAAGMVSMSTMTTTTSSAPSGAIAKTVIGVAIVGALNWGLVGFFQFNLVQAIFGGAAPEQPSTASRVVYAIVGLCGLVGAFLLPKLHAEPRNAADYTGRIR
jgi:uncharacterized membrane protein YuzA (DUF378 family)